MPTRMVGNLSARVSRSTISASICPYEVEDIIITNGGSEALQWAFLLTCDPGEEILVPEPFYTNYRGFAAPYDVVIKPITTKPDDGFVLPGRGGA